MTRIAIVGTGYVGLTTGACFAHLGHDVTCADIDESKVERLSRGEIPIFEHGLEDLVKEGLRNGNLRFVLGAANAVAECEIAFLCVPTPQGDDGSADLTYVEQAAREIKEVLPYEAIVVNKSTVPVGSAKVVERVLRRTDVKVVSNPEFLREGSAVDDFLRPDRVVVGCDDRAAAIKVGSLYDKVNTQIIITDPPSAETIKYAANAFLATKLSFINAIAAICEGVGADVNDVVVGMGYDKRIGSEFLRPGPGWGGVCFPKDSKALLKIAHDAGYQFDLLDGVVAVNNQQFDRVTEKIRLAAGGLLRGVLRRRVGPDVQGRHRRPARLARRCRSSAGWSPPAPRSRPTTRRSTGPELGLPDDIQICRRPGGRHRRRRRARRAHRVGRLPLGRARQGCRRR